MENFNDNKDYGAIIRNLDIFRDKAIAIKKLNGGLTNISFVIKLNQSRYVVRFAPRSYRALGINKKAEVYNTTIAAALGLGPRVVKFYSQYNALVVEYLPGRQTTVKDFKNKDTLIRMAQLLAKLHSSSKKFLHATNIYTWMEKSLITLQKAGCLPAHIKMLSKKFNALRVKVGPLEKTFPCHQDLVMANIILCRGGVRLIDWEYATNADYRFDLANLSVMGKFLPYQDKLLVSEYVAACGKGNAEVLLGELQCFKSLAHIRETIWAITQWASKSPKPESQSFYRRYIEHHFRAAEKCVWAPFNICNKKHSLY